MQRLRERGNLRALALPAAWLVVLVACYLPDLGRGFIRDDFAWIQAGRFVKPSDVVEVFGHDQGFYRPLVSLSFGLDERLFGLDPWWFGLSNLLMVLFAGAALARVLLSLGVHTAGAVSAAALWAFNPHGIGSSVMWISGRTSLLALLFALLAAWASLHGRMVVSAIACTFALLSKEEAAMLPVVLAVWAAARPDASTRGSTARGVTTLLWLSSAVVVYAALRSRTAAFLPWNAPSYYAPTSSVGVLIRNGLEYLDRTSTFMVSCVLIAALVSWRMPRLTQQERRWSFLGLVWAASGLATTICVPVRSSLYAVYPSAGVALGAGVVIGALWRQAGHSARTRLLGVCAAVPLLMLPIQRSRNTRMVKHAELSSQVVALIREHRRELAGGTVLVLVDDPRQRVNLRNTFGTLIDTAAEVTAALPAGRVWIEPDPGGEPRPASSRALVTYDLQGESLVPRL